MQPSNKITWTLCGQVSQAQVPEFLQGRDPSNSWTKYHSSL